MEWVGGKRDKVWASKSSKHLKQAVEHILRETTGLLIPKQLQRPSPAAITGSNGPAEGNHHLQASLQPGEQSSTAAALQLSPTDRDGSSPLLTPELFSPV